MKKVLILLFIFISFKSFSQKFYLSSQNLKDSSGIDLSMTNLAKKIIAVYKEQDKISYFDNLFRFELVAKNYPNSLLALDSLRSFFRLSNPEVASVREFEYETYAQTKLFQLKNSKPFKESFLTILSESHSKLNEFQSNFASGYFWKELEPFKKTFSDLLKKQFHTDSISLQDAKAICIAYADLVTYSHILAFGKSFFENIEKQLYIIQDSVQIKTKDGSTIQAIVVRSKKVTTSLPAILNFNIYTGPMDKRLAKIAAIKGYVGVVANTRGKGLSPQNIEPFEKDASDAYDIIEWISKQSWCNGKVGMYGGSYLGFSQWAATKELHPALKTIIPQVSVGIGIDYPMENNVFMSYMLRWIHLVTNTKQTDNAAFLNESHWDSLFTKWYKTGARFRDLDSLEGRRSEIFQRWLQHPSYDSFWQNMVPYKIGFSKINIPVLTITGYFDDDQLGAFYYYKEHLLNNKNSNHTLLIGPYSHGGAQGTPSMEWQGYKIDQVANINITKLLFKWFDYTLKDSIKPDLLKDKVNYQVMGTNTWKHKPSIADMNNDTLKFYFSTTHLSGYNKLTTKKDLEKEFITQEVNFLDRTDTTDISDEKVLTKAIEQGEYIAFRSEPLENPITINGSFFGTIKAITNKKDFDLNIQLYEQLPNGMYFNLSHFLGRASYTQDRSKRKLLEPGKEETISYYNSFFTSKKLEKGSRLVVLLGINKDKYWQINYGSGKEVSDETIADGNIPLEIKWMNDSNIEIPVWRGE